mmetsp:Transcript_87137/g.219413  ORF Transcript_87137/g.219413 Transcript_87137/m.219413 type:complete len:121 (-) Transcript_87137:35-397(-)
MRPFAMGSVAVAILAVASDRGFLASADEVDIETHQLGPSCISSAEDMERNIGLFDDLLLSTEKRESIAEGMTDLGSSLTGKSMATFKQSFIQKLEDVHNGGGPFGASDACLFMLQHYGEL